MSTHNICFHREIRKILCGYPLLSVAMNSAILAIQNVFSEESDHTAPFSFFLTLPDLMCVAQIENKVDRAAFRNA